MQNEEASAGSASNINPGAVIANRYRLQRSLGSGAFGEVFLAEDIKFQPPRPVAIKFLHKQFIVEPQVREELVQEASTLARLRHPNILRVIDFEITPHEAYIIMEYADGGSLSAILRPGPDRRPVQFPLDRVLLYLGQLADALDYAHSQNLIHRDIKPLNVLLDSRGQPLLADFGLATPLANSQASVMVNVNTTGTPQYMAPEQWRGQAGRASDIYALGVMTYQMIAGQPPFLGNTEALAFQHLNAPVPPLAVRGFRLPYSPALDAVFAGVLAKDPHQRTRPALEFYRRFREALAAPVPPVQEAPTTPLSVFDTGQSKTNLVKPNPAEFPTDRARRDNPALARTEVAKKQVPVIPAQPQPAINPTLVQRPARTGTASRSNWWLLPGLVAGGLSLVGLAAVLLFLLLNKNPASIDPNAGIQSPAATTAPSPAATVASSPTPAPATTNPRTVSASPGPTEPLTNATLLHTLTGHTGPVHVAAWSPDGKYLATGSDDHYVRLWSPTGDLLYTLAFAGTNKPITALAWSPDSNSLAIASMVGQAQLWSATTQAVVSLNGHTDSVVSLAWSPDGKFLATGSSDKTIRLWSAGGSYLYTLFGSVDSVLSLAWSPDSKTIAAGYGDNVIRFWSSDGKPVNSFSSSSNLVSNLAWSPDGKDLAATYNDNKIRLWSPDGTSIATLSGHADKINSIDWSPGSRQSKLVSASADKTGRIWLPDSPNSNTISGKTYNTLTAQSALLNIKWSPSGRTIAAGSAGGQVVLYDDSGKTVATLDAHKGAVYAVAWSPDSKTLASVGEDATIQLWGVSEK